MATIVTYDGRRIPSLLDVDPRTHAFYYDDFAADLGNDTVSQLGSFGTGAHIVDASADGGVFRLDAGSNLDGKGPNVQFRPFAVSPTVGKDIYFECGLTFKDEAAVDLFIGLSKINTSVLTTDDIDPDAIGFVSFEDSSIDVMARDDAGTGNLTQTLDVGTVTLDTFTRFGIAISGTGQANYYINDSVVATATDNIPNLPLVPTFIVKACAASSDQPEIFMDYLYCMKTR